MAVSSMNPSQIMVKPRTLSCPAAKGAGRVFFVLSAILFLSASIHSEAATNTALSLAFADVSAMVSASHSGDTVMVPAGIATWTNTLTINNDIQLIGAGQGQTIITNNVSRSVNGGIMLSWSTVSNGFCRLSGFSFEGGAVDASHNLSSQNFYFGGTCHALRIDDCDFAGLNQDHVLEFFNWIYGVIDHCNFTTPATAIMVHHDAYGGSSYGDGSWTDSDQWGTTNALYIESCKFVGNPPFGALDCVDGARIVFRFNYLTNSAIGSHGTESTGRARGIRLIEVYNNTFLAQEYQTFENQPLQEAIYLRGGTATIFSNTVYGGYKYMIKFSDYRLYPNQFTAWYNITGANPWDSDSATVSDSGTYTGTNGASSLQDASKSWTSNQWVGYFLYDITQDLGVPIGGNTTNSLSFSGYNPYGGSFVVNSNDKYEIRLAYASIDQPGYGPGDLLTGTTPTNTVTGTPAWPHEVFNPIYEWTNSFTYLSQESYPGAKTGSDALLVTQGVNWLDDVGRPGYTPLTYPHPLISGGSVPATTILSPPSSLQVH